MTGHPAKRWHLSWRADPRARRIADRHYNRQSIGAAQFVPPGRCLVLATQDGAALWITSWPFAEYVRHAWAGAWVCSAFRNERDPGRCFRRVGFVEVGRTKEAGLIALQLRPDDMPPREAPLGSQQRPRDMTGHPPLDAAFVALAVWTAGIAALLAVAGGLLWWVGKREGR